MEPDTAPPKGNQDSWIERYVTWALRRSPLTPRHFHEGIAYSLAACSIAGRLCVQTPQGRVYPNLYTLLLGKTSIYAKSVAMDISQELAEATMISDRIINSVFTPEAVVGELAGETPANLSKLTADLQDRWRQSASWGPCRMFRLDEAGMFFNGLRRDYNAGLSDLWMKLYDCPATLERTTFKHGLHVIQHPVLCCLFATTPASIGYLLRDRLMWLNGFWPRWNFCVGGGYTDFTPSLFEEADDLIREPLYRLGNHNLAQWKADDPLVVPIDAQVIREYENVLESNRRRTFENEDGYMEAALGRLHTKRLKLALILAALAEPDAPKIRVASEHWEATERPVKQIELDMVEALRQCRNSEKADLEDRIIRFLLRNNRQATFRAIRRTTNLSACELKPVLEAMTGAGICSVTDLGKATLVTLLKEGEL